MSDTFQSDTTQAPPPAPVIVDLRPMIPPQRHATVFAAIEGLAPGASFVLINDHAPVPLLRRMEEIWPGLYDFQYLSDGPEVWQVAITRRSA
ncbi:DUF2249 domain-containing protein [Shimia sp.]|uniref:DUF2249 domain-containing protein n=1 Tax=Shimia sp. TaxID=1954381 RepID=UPI0035683D85